MATNQRSLVVESKISMAQRAEAERLMKSLAEKGILAIYGGGSRSKGHGFWLYRATPEYIAKYAEHQHGVIDLMEVSPVMQNDGKASGNPAFTMFEDAEKLLG